MTQRPRSTMAHRPTAEAGRLVLFAMWSSVIIVFARMTSLGVALQTLVVI